MHFFLTSQNSLKIGKRFRYPIFLVWIVIGISVIIKIHSVRNIAWSAVSFSLHTLAFYISHWLEIVFCPQIQPTWSLRKNVHDCTLYWERSFQIFHAARDSSIFLMERRSWELEYDIIIFNLFRMLHDHIFNIQFLFLNSFNFWASLTFYRLHCQRISFFSQQIKMKIEFFRKKIALDPMWDEKSLHDLAWVSYCWNVMALMVIQFVFFEDFLIVYLNSLSLLESEWWVSKLF